MDDFQSITQSITGPGNGFVGVLEAGTGGQQCGAVSKRPAGILGMGQFQLVDLPRNGQIDDLLHTIHVMPMEHNIQCDRKLQPFGDLDGTSFFFERRRASQPIVFPGP